MREYSVLNINTHQFGDLETIFPGWKGADERICVYSPHDDDAILGAGYVMKAAMDEGAEVHIFIVCSGNAGYSSLEEKESIVEKRRMETKNCYKAFGIPEEHIVFLNYSDFSAMSYVGWNVAPEREGHFRHTITELRKRKISRILVPNHYHEHMDHIATYYMAAYDAPQSGDAHSIAWGNPYPVRSVAQYSVWAELDPEDAMVCGRDVDLRANTLILASADVEKSVHEGIMQYVSQKEIIENLILQRKGRMLEDGRYLEVYLRFDPRPVLNYEPYKQLLQKFS